MFKSCSACKETRDTSEFYYDKTNQVLRSACKRCVMGDMKKRRRVVGSSAWWQRRYGRKKRTAKLKGHSYEICFSEFKRLMCLENCYYCEKPPKMKSIDRVDNNKSYIDGNVVMSCMECNFMKGALTIEQLNMLHTKIVRHQKRHNLDLVV